MFPRRIVWAVAAGIVGPVALGGPAADRPPAAKVVQLVNMSSPGVAELFGYADGREELGAGFLLDDQTVVTNAHVVESVKTLSVRFKGQRGFIPCQLIALDTDLDLAAVRLKDRVAGRSLALSRSDTDPSLGQEIVIIGHPRGLEHSFFEGKVNAAVRTRAELYRALGWKGKLPPRQARLKAIQHSVPSTIGMSGAPVLDLDGFVVGVQREGVPNEPNINFCIPHYYIRELDLTQAPKPFPGQGPRNDFDKVLNQQSVVRPPPGGGPIDEDLSCYHWGFIPKLPAADIFLRYIGDKDGFRAFIPFNTFEAILNRNDVVHVTHPKFRFAFLVPNAYTLTQDIRADPVGITVTLTSDDPQIPFPLNTLRLTAWRIPRPIQSYQKDKPAGPPQKSALQAIGRLGMIVRNGSDTGRQPVKVDPPAPAAGDPTARVTGGGAEVAWIHAVMRDLAWRYPAETHHLRIFGAEGRAVPQNPAREDVVVYYPFSDREVRVTPDLRAARFRGVLASPTRFDRGWAYHFAIHNNVAIVVDYEFVFSALLNQPQRGFPKDLAERMFVAASLSFY
jgi:hypothetical protein